MELLHSLSEVLNVSVKAALSAHQKPTSFSPSYGTAGFRANAKLLDSTVMRCGVVTALRSMSKGKACGLMLTASHNPVEDNGVKIVEPTGEMLDPSLEALVTDVAQAEDPDKAMDRILALADRLSPVMSDGIVIMGYDTRPSNQRLAEAAAAGIRAMGARVINAGLVTTPQLHFLVTNFNSAPPGEPARYMRSMCNAFVHLSRGTTPLSTSLYVDCANGVGSHRLLELKEQLATAGLSLDLRNCGEGELNHLVGADYVQKERKVPENFSDFHEGSRGCSIDGDADRAVFFTLQGGEFTLIDGDRIAVLAVQLVKELVAALPEDLQSNIQVGVVQTAYANGASSAYMSGALGVEVVVVPTGVKWLHHAAQRFDVGVYFEANGHGTLLLHPTLLQRLHADADSCEAAAQLLLLSQMVNQAVGDSLSVVLLVELAMRRRRWTFADWLALYADLPSRHAKLTVTDRHVIATEDADRRVVSPAGLQEAVDAAVAARGGPPARAFVRASGTEDAVRVFAEAATQADADVLAADVARAVHRLAGGVGHLP